MPNMTGDIRQLLAAGPFEPFYIVTSSAKRYRIPSADHASTNPRGSRVVVWFDDDSNVVVSALHITAFEKDSPKKSKRG
jgi:hypothetical protein